MTTMTPGAAAEQIKRGMMDTSATEVARPHSTVALAINEQITILRDVAAQAHDTVALLEDKLSAISGQVGEIPKAMPLPNEPPEGTALGQLMQVSGQLRADVARLNELVMERV